MTASVEDSARLVVDCGFRLHQNLGPGLLESAYELFWRTNWQNGGFSSNVRSRSQSDMMALNSPKASGPIYF